MPYKCMHIVLHLCYGFIFCIFCIFSRYIDEETHADNYLSRASLKQLQSLQMDGVGL